MEYTVRLPLYLNWKALKSLLGWPYGRAQTARLMKKEIMRSKGSRSKGTYREWVEPNPDPFPAGVKLLHVRNCPPLWFAPHVLSWMERRGMPVPGNLQFS